MSYRIDFTERARRDMNRLLESLAERSPEAADRLSAQLDNSLSRLEQFPLSCGIAYENQHFTEEVRHLIFGLSKHRRYKALFTIRGEDIVILAVRAPGEQPMRPDEIGG